MIEDKPASARCQAPANQEPNALLHDQLCFAIYSATHAFTRRYKDHLQKLNLTYPQYLVLTVLWETDAPTVKAIGDRLYLDSGTLTPILKRLELGGLVRRTRDPRDERQVRVSLTLAGQDLRAKTTDVRTAMVCATGLSADQISRLRDDIIHLRDQLRGSGH